MINKIVIRDHGSSQWLEFDAAVDVLVAQTIEDVVPTLTEIERRVHADNLFAAG